MRAITYRAEFMKNGEKLFDAVMFAGTLGVYTGMKAGAFSVSQNTRYKNKNPLYLIENIIMMYGGFTENSWQLRQALTECNNYDCAFKMLAYQPMSSLGYNIVAGTKGDEAAVIARNNFGPAHISALDSANGTWFVAQANSDSWVDCTGRCASAVKNMEKVGQTNISPETIRSEVLYVNPNFNKETLYNTNFVPRDGIIDTKPLNYTGSIDTADDIAPFFMDSLSVFDIMWDLPMLW